MKTFTTKNILASALAYNTVAAMCINDNNNLAQVNPFEEIEDFFVEDIGGIGEDIGDFFEDDFVDFWEDDFVDFWEDDFVDFWEEDFVDFWEDDFVDFW